MTEGELTEPEVKGHFGYRPALDGLRAIAVLGVVTFHLAPPLAPGGWLGVDLFFVLSGFLITSLLLTEIERWGRISLGHFWLRRARRLLPGVVVVLAFVLAAAHLWLPPGRQRSAALDVLAGQFYVANWRFLLGDESYFAQLAMPSPVRHFWSLSIEEQFYIFFPLLLTIMVTIGLRKRGQIFVLAAIAVASAAWMAIAYDPAIDTSRIYYGTDTRAFELMIGAIGAMAVPGAGVAANTARKMGRLAWPALVVWLVAMLFVPENASFMYLGGLVVLASLALVMVAAATYDDTGSFARIIGTEPLRRIGLVSYPWYLWHWPVWLFLTGSRLHLSGFLVPIAQALISFGLAWATYHWVERPIRSRGFTALVPGRPRLSVIVCATAFLAVTTTAVSMLNESSNPAAVTGNGRNIELSAEPYDTPESVSVLLLGNSIPESLYVPISGTSWRNVTVASDTSFGCDPFKGTRILPDGTEQKSLGDCVGWQQTWPDTVSEVSPDIVVFFIPQTLLFDYSLDGTTYAFGTAAHDEFVRSSLDSVRSAALDAGAQQFAISTLACHDMPFADDYPELQRVSDDRATQDLNSVAVGWANDNGVTVIDTYGALCANGYADLINDVALYKDGLHYTDQSAPIVWSWMMPQLQKAVVEQ